MLSERDRFLGKASWLRHLLCIASLAFGVALPSVTLAVKWVPIAVDDMTIIIPVQQEWSVSVGTQDPGPMCSASSKPRWAIFACNFLTKSLWEQAGRPKLDSNGNVFNNTWPGWEPIYSTDPSHPENVGLLEGFEYKYGPTATRFMPWSVRAQQGTNANIFTQWDNGGDLERYQLLGFDGDYGPDSSPGPEFPYQDYKDPTLTYEAGALAAIIYMIEFHRQRYQQDSQALYWLVMLGDPDEVPPRGLVDWFYPDYDKDGTVMLAIPNGGTVELPSLEAAAEYAAVYGVRFANGSLNSFVEGKTAASELANHLNRYVVYMYHAQNVWYFDDISNNAFNKRWKDLTDATAGAATLRGTRVLDVCHSNSCYKVASAIKSYGNIDLFAVNAAHAFWSQPLWLSYLEDRSGNAYLAQGSDPVTLVTGGSGMGSGVYGFDSDDADPIWGSIGSAGVHEATYRSTSVEATNYDCSHPLAGMLYNCGAINWVNSILESNAPPF